MPKALKAPTDGICGRCGNPYTAGMPVTYSRDITKKNERYHYPSCRAVNQGLAAASIAAAVPAAAAAAAGVDVAAVAVPAVPAVPAVAVAAAVPVPAAIAAANLRKIRTLTARSQWFDIVPALMAAGVNRAMLVGPPGTGKSRIAFYGVQCNRVLCHEEMGREDIIGTFIQVKGETKWIDGPATIAMRTGTRLLLDEIDRASSEVMSMLYGVLDDSPFVALPTGEFVTAAAGFNVICTSNISANDLQDAVLDRIQTVTLALTPHADALASLKHKVADGRGEKLAAYCSNYYRTCIGTSEYEWEAKPTFRRQRTFAELLAAGIDETIAATAVFGRSGKEVLSCLTTAR